MNNRGPQTLSRILLSVFLCALALLTTLSVSANSARAGGPPDSSAVLTSPLTWNTFLGGASDDYGRGIARDGSGNIYVTGISSTTWGTPIRAFSGFNNDAFVAKLDSNGALLWNTFLGGDSVDHSTGIAVDESGNVYVAGISGGSWGTPVRAFSGFNDDSFAAKLDTNGVLTWNTFLGGDGVDWGQGIAVDGNGKIYVAGISTGTWGTPVRAFTGFNDDAFTAKLNSDGALTWNTFLGGIGVDHSTGIAADASGNAHVAGISTGTWGSPVRAFTGTNDDAFAVKLDTNGALTWNTFLGGSGVDHAAGITVDGSANVYLTGISGAPWGSPIRPFSGTNDDAFSVKLASNGTLAWNTFLGTDTPDRGAGIATDGSGNLYVTGLSDDTWGTPVRAFSGILTDTFAAKLDSGGGLIGNTFLGGIQDDNGEGIALDGSGNVFVMGTSSSTWGTPLRAFTPTGADSFVAKIPDIVSCAPKPEPPLLLKPNNSAVVDGPKIKFDWTDAACATTYKLIVREGSKSGPVVVKKTDLKKSKATVKTGLTPGVTYFWRVEAINTFGKSKSAWSSFTVE